MIKNIFISILILCFSSYAWSQTDGTSKQKSREFLMSCTYGVLTGTLVGAASLAFSDSPGDNLDRVAKGASLGLYAGIFLGYYVMNLDENPPAYTESYDTVPQSSKLLIIPGFVNGNLDSLALKYRLFEF